MAVKSVKSIGASYRFILAGTPIKKPAQQALEHFDYLMPEYQRFRTEVEMPVVQLLLKEEGKTYYVLTVTTPKEQCLNLAEHFHVDEASAFCISLKADGADTL